MEQYIHFGHELCEVAIEEALEHLEQTYKDKMAIRRSISTHGRAQHMFEESEKMLDFTYELNKNRIIPIHPSQPFRSSVREFFESKQREHQNDAIQNRLFDGRYYRINDELDIFRNYRSDHYLVFIHYNGCTRADRKAFIIPAEDEKELSYIFTYPYITEEENLFRSDLTNELLDWWNGQKVVLPDDQRIQFSDTYKNSYHLECDKFLQSEERWFALADLITKLKDYAYDAADIRSAVKDFLGSVYTLAHFHRGMLFCDIADQYKDIKQMYNTIFKITDTKPNDDTLLDIEQHWHYSSSSTKRMFLGITGTINCPWVIRPDGYLRADYF